MVENSETGLMKEYQLNIDMWKHYDNLRQNKNQIFLTANTILAAAVGIILDKQQSVSASTGVALPVTLLGFVVCILWFLILSRNAGYIKFHRHRAYSLELEKPVLFTTFSEEWGAFKKQLHPWERWSSVVIDRALTISFGIFWLALLFYFLAYF